MPKSVKLKVSNSIAFALEFTLRYFPAAPVKFAGVSDSPVKLLLPPPPELANVILSPAALVPVSYTHLTLPTKA